jgi:hypothetical protein
MRAAHAEASSTVAGVALSEGDEADPSKETALL